MNITIKKLGSSRTQASVILDEARVRELFDQAVIELGASVCLKGFRLGKAPKEMLREHITQEKIHEWVIQQEMPVIMQELTGKHALRPIIRPRVELHSLAPMALIMTLVEKPEVNVVRKKIKLPKEVMEKDKEKNDAQDAAKKTPEDAKQKEDEKLIELIAEHTTVDLAPELVSDEAEQIIGEHARRMEQFGMQFDDWLTAQKKSIADLIHEMQPDAEKRLKIRFGIGALMQDLRIDVTESEMQQAIDALLSPLTGVQHDALQNLYKPGERAYEQFKFQKKVEKLLEQLRSA